MPAISPTTPLEPGDRAPDFTLPARPREPLSLGELLPDGPVVLLFFPFAYSSTCTEELCTVGENWAAWEDVGAQVLGVSVDSPYVTARFADDYELPFPVLSDFNEEVIEAYGVRRENIRTLRGMAERAAFVIAPDGIIAYAWVGEHPGKLPPFEELKEAVRRLAG